MKVIIVYEIYHREFDNALLLKTALESVGFDTEIIYKMDLVKCKYTKETRIVFIPNSYNNESFFWYYLLLNSPNSIFIDLQYEQVLSKHKDALEIYRHKGLPENIYHFTWGEKYLKTLKGFGLNERYLYNAGALHLDFLRPGFEVFWLKKVDLLDKYNMDIKKELCLFISSFAGAENEAIKETYAESVNFDYAQYLTDLATKSRYELILWFEKYLTKYGDKVIVYRPHPLEKINERLYGLERKFPNNFKIISDYNIKQWIKISDRIFTWYSTAIGECLAANKIFQILRPLQIKDEFEVESYVNANFIDCYEKFEANMCNSVTHDYPIDLSIMREFYTVEDIPTYKKITTFVQKLENNNIQSDIYVENFLSKRKEFIRRRHVFLKYKLKKIYQFLYKRGFLKIKNKYIRSKFAVDDWEMQSCLPDSTLKEEQLKKIVKMGC